MKIKKYRFKKMMLSSLLLGTSMSMLLTVSCNNSPKLPKVETVPKDSFLKGIENETLGVLQPLANGSYDGIKTEYSDNIKYFGPDKESTQFIVKVNREDTFNRDKSYYASDILTEEELNNPNLDVEKSLKTETQSLNFSRFLKTKREYLLKDFNKETQKWEYSFLKSYFPTLTDFSRFIRSLEIKNGKIIIEKLRPETNSEGQTTSQNSTTQNDEITLKQYNLILSRILQIADHKQPISYESFFADHESYLDKNISYFFSFEKSEIEDQLSKFMQKFRYVFEKENRYEYSLPKPTKEGEKYCIDYGCTTSKKDITNSKRFRWKPFEPTEYDKSKTIDIFKADGSTIKAQRRSVQWIVENGLSTKDFWNRNIFLFDIFLDNPELEGEEVWTQDSGDPLLWVLQSHASFLKAQTIQFRMLIRFVRLMKKLSESVNLPPLELPKPQAGETEEQKAKREAEIKRLQEKYDAKYKKDIEAGKYGIVNSEQTISNQIANNAKKELKDYAEALKEYLSVSYALGFAKTSISKKQIELQVFPGGIHYLEKADRNLRNGNVNSNSETTETINDFNLDSGLDLRDTWRWAKTQLEEFVEPLLTQLGDVEYIGQGGLFEQTFENKSDRAQEKFNIIWKNIKEIDGLDKPKFFEYQESLNKYKQLEAGLAKLFSWQYQENTKTNT